MGEIPHLVYKSGGLDTLTWAGGLGPIFGDYLAIEEYRYQFLFSHKSMLVISPICLSVLMLLDDCRSKLCLMPYFLTIYPPVTLKARFQQSRSKSYRNSWDNVVNIQIERRFNHALCRQRWLVKCLLIHCLALLAFFP